MEGDGKRVGAFAAIFTGSFETTNCASDDSNVAVAAISPLLLIVIFLFAELPPWTSPKPTGVGAFTFGSGM